MSRLSSAVAVTNSALRSPIVVSGAVRSSNLGRLNAHLGLSNTLTVSSAVKEYAELVGDRALAHLADPSAYPLEDDSVEKLLVEHIQTLSSDRQKAIKGVGKSLVADSAALRAATANGLNSATSAEELIVARYTSPSGLRGAGRVIGVRNGGGLAQAADRLTIRTVKVAATAENLTRGTFATATAGGIRRDPVAAKDVSFDTIQLVLNSIKCLESQQKKDNIFIHGVLLTSEGEVKGDDESLGEFKTGDKTKTYDNRVIVSKALNPDPDVTQTFGALITLIEQDSKRLGALLERVMERLLVVVRGLIEKALKGQQDEILPGELSTTDLPLPTDEKEIGEIILEQLSKILVDIIMEAVAMLLEWLVERLGDDVFGDVETDTIAVNAEDGFGGDASVEVLPTLRFSERNADYKVNLSWRLT